CPGPPAQKKSAGHPKKKGAGRTIRSLDEHSDVLPNCTSTAPHLFDVSVPGSLGELVQLPCPITPLLTQQNQPLLARTDASDRKRMHLGPHRRRAHAQPYMLPCAPA